MRASYEARIIIKSWREQQRRLPLSVRPRLSGRAIGEEGTQRLFNSAKGVPPPLSLSTRRLVRLIPAPLIMTTIMSFVARQRPT